MENNIELCVVDTEHLSIYTFANSQEEAQEKLYQAIERKQEDIKTWESHCRTYPDTESFKNYLTEARNKKYSIMPYDDFVKMEREYYINCPLTEVTEDTFYDMLNVLPPIKWYTINGIEMFCISEMLTGSYTSQYMHDKRNDKFYHKTVDILDKTTWGYNFI